MLYRRNLKIDLLAGFLILLSLTLLAACYLNVAWNYVSENVQAALSSLATAIFILAALLKTIQDDRELKHWRKLHAAQGTTIMPKRSI